MHDEAQEALDGWDRGDGPLAQHVREYTRKNLEAYRAQPDLVEEHAREEQEILTGGYAERQLPELIQNAADALHAAGRRGRVHLLLTQNHLYCANEGVAVDAGGASAILAAHLSRKEGGQVGCFGLGFKSILALTQRLQLFSKTGSFAFDAETARRRIREVVPAAVTTPVLRVAEPLDPGEYAARDDALMALMTWATTVVRVELRDGYFERLSRDFAEFPREYVLFSQHVDRLVLEDVTAQAKRDIVLTHSDGLAVISEGEDERRWKLFQKEIPPEQISSDQEPTGSVRGRPHETCTLTWAVPLPIRRGRGEIWTYFPTRDRMTLAGILNASWSTHSDRLNLLDDPRNRAILDRAADLVVESYPTLFDPSSPGRVLDVLPAEEPAGWVDEIISDLVYERLSGVPAVPSCTGRLCKAGDLQLRPKLLTQGVKELEGKMGPIDCGPEWCHATVEERERRPRAERLGSHRCSDVGEWVEAIASQGNPAASIMAIAVVETLWRKVGEFDRECILSRPFLLTEDERLVAPADGQIFLPSGDSCEPATASIIHHAVAADPNSRRTLQKRFGVAELSPQARLVELTKRIENGDEIDWEEFWNVVRRLPKEETLAVLHEELRGWLNVRTLEGDFRGLFEVLLPGPVVPHGGERDRHVTLDVRYHEPDLTLLKRLGAVDRPTPGHCMSLTAKCNGPWFEEYHRYAREELRRQLSRESTRPRSMCLDFSDGEACGPLDPLVALSEEGRARYVEHLLPHVKSDPTWSIGHTTRSNFYPTLEIEPPSIWALRHYGCLETSLGPVPLQAAVGPELWKWEALLPVARCSSTDAGFLNLAERLDELEDLHWKTALERAASFEDGDLVSRFYAAAAGLCNPPDQIRCREQSVWSTRPPDEVTVVRGQAEAANAEGQGIAYLQVSDSDAARRLAENWRLRIASPAAVRFEPAGVELPLVDRFPGLRYHLPVKEAGRTLQPCVDLWQEDETGARRGLDFVARDERFLHLDTLSDADLLERVLSDLDVALEPPELQEVVQHFNSKAKQKKLKRIQAQLDLPSKLLEAVGAPAIEKRLPPAVLAALNEHEEDLDPRRIAHAALSIFGVETLKTFADDLEEAGFDPPRQWCGSERAREFVSELGFPLVFAGTERGRRAPYEEIDGPSALELLHPFQKEITARIRSFFLEAIPGRGLLSLPTGAGKTRVTVQAVVEAIRAKELDGCIVWIASSDELCEQAVQTWFRVWQAIGPARRLRISRLWGQTNDRIVPVPEQPHIVVATFQTLDRRVDRPEMEWLKKASCIIVDEAHGSVAPSYTRILRWFGLESRITERRLIGLTATPFRGGGADEEETRRLVSRYDRRRFDDGVFGDEDPYDFLQDQRILARVRHHILPGSDLQLEAGEIEHLRTFKELPASAERRLGEKSERNEVIIQSIRELPSDWPVLLFAASVDQAKLLAALLTMRGVPAQAVSAEGDVRARRFYVEEFKNGGIRVLTNYGVLSTGFDAPAVKAVYVARPVYSKGLYQQMIGRGLRGPLNGGKEECLIVNVEDNIERYGEQLAFHHFDHLWQRQQDLVEA